MVICEITGHGEIGSTICTGLVLEIDTTMELNTKLTRLLKGYQTKRTDNTGSANEFVSSRMEGIHSGDGQCTYPTYLHCSGTGLEVCFSTPPASHSSRVGKRLHSDAPRDVETSKKYAKWDCSRSSGDDRTTS